MLLIPLIFQVILSGGSFSSLSVGATSEFVGSCSDYGTALRGTDDRMDPFEIADADIEDGNVCEPFAWSSPSEKDDNELPLRTASGTGLTE